MKGEDRKAAIAAWKERKTVAGIYAVRCVPTGEIWIGESRNIDSQQNGIWFQLRMGNHMNRDLQAAWTKHGANAFVFEELERLPEETVAYVQRTQLKERAAAWVAQYDGRKIL